MEKKKQYEEFVNMIAEGATSSPLTLGMYLAASGLKPMPKELADYLKDCFEKNLSVQETIEGWM